MALQTCSNLALMKVGYKEETFALWKQTQEKLQQNSERENPFGYYTAMFKYADKDTYGVQVNLNRIDLDFEGSIERDVASEDSAAVSGSDIPVVITSSESRLLEVSGPSERMSGENRGAKKKVR